MAQVFFCVSAVLGAAAAYASASKDSASGLDALKKAISSRAGVT